MDGLEFGEQRLYRRDLPHLENGGRAYFVTVNTVRELSGSERDAIASVLRSGEARGHYYLYVAVVMPDHFHVSLRPREMTDGKFQALATIVQSWKSLVVKACGSKALFPAEWYDRVIRVDEWSDTTSYIRCNPVVAGLCEVPDEYPWLIQGCPE